MLSYLTLQLLSFPTRRSSDLFKAQTSFETIQQVLTEEPLPPSRRRGGVSRDLETVCLKCLHKDPGKRYASAEALAERSEEHTSELQSHSDIVCRLLLEKKKIY